MIYFIHSLDDLEDAIQECKETAMAFPELMSSHKEIALSPSVDGAEMVCHEVGKYFNSNECIATDYKDTGEGYLVRVIYTLSPEEQEECWEAMEQFALDLTDDVDKRILEEALEINQNLEKKNTEKLGRLEKWLKELEDLEDDR